jgi:hypothetical protein
VIRPNRTAAEVLAESDAGWRLIRGDKRRPAQVLKFMLLSPDGVVFRGAYDGEGFGAARDLAMLRRTEPAIWAWLSVTLADLWEGGLR